MALTQEKIAELDKKYGYTKSTGLTPEKIAALDKKYGYSEPKQTLAEQLPRALAKGALSFGNTLTANIPRMISKDVDEVLTGDNPLEKAAINIGGLGGLVAPMGAGAKIASGVMKGVTSKLGTSVPAKLAGLGAAGAAENVTYGTSDMKEYFDPNKIAERAVIGGALGVAIPAGLGGVSGAVSGIGQGLKKLPAKFYNEILGKLPKSAEKYGHNPMRTLLDEKIVSSDVVGVEDLTAKVVAKKQEIGQKLADAYAGMTGTMNLRDKVLAPLRSRIRELEKMPNQNKTALSKLSDIYEDFKSQNLENLTPQQAWAKAQEIAEMTKFGGTQADDQIANKVRRQMRFAIMDELKAKNPALRTLNQKYGDLTVAEDLLNKQARAEGARQINSPSSKAAGGLVAGVDALSGGGLSLGSIVKGMLASGVVKYFQTPNFKTNFAQAVSNAKVQEIADLMSKSPKFAHVVGAFYGKDVSTPQKLKNVVAEAEIVDTNAPRLPAPYQGEDLGMREGVIFGRSPDAQNAPDFTQGITAQTKALPAYKDPSLRGTAPTTNVTAGNISEEGYRFSQNKTAPIQMPAVLDSDKKSVMNGFAQVKQARLPAPKTVYGKGFVVPEARSFVRSGESGKVIMNPSAFDVDMLPSMKEEIGNATVGERVAGETRLGSGVIGKTYTANPANFPAWSRDAQGKTHTTEYINDILDRVENGKPMTAKMANDAKMMFEKAHANMLNESTPINYPQYDNFKRDVVPATKAGDVSSAPQKEVSLGDDFETDFSGVDMPMRRSGQMNLGGQDLYSEARKYKSAEEFAYSYAKDQKFPLDVESAIRQTIEKNNQKIADAENAIKKISEKDPKIEGNLSRRKDFSSLNASVKFTEENARSYGTFQNIIASAKESNAKLEKELVNPSDDIKKYVEKIQSKATGFKPKSSLTDIWNKAHGKTAGTAPVVPAAYAAIGVSSVGAIKAVKDAKTAKDLNEAKKKYGLTTDQINKIKKVK